MNHLTALIGACALSVAALGALADVAPLDAPTGDVILTVSGKIAVTNAGETAEFDLDMLKQLPATVFSTGTTWTDGVHEFTGVSLLVMTERLGIEASALQATAINDYAIDVPMTDAVEGGPILAYLMDGEPMSVRDKGPIWLIYPFDSNPEYQTEVIYSRSIWQLSRLMAKD